MKKESIKIEFRNESERLKQQNLKIEKLVLYNKELTKFNSAFMHPYLFGFEAEHLQNLIDTKTINKEKVFGIFARSFFDFRTTALFIDGYFKQRSCLKPFCPLIDQSVILCIQKDYAGAINILLPVIEGSIRHYLVNIKGKQNEKIMQTSELIKVFYYLKEDYLQIHKDYYSTGKFKDYDRSFCYEKNQVNALIKLNRKYIDLWFSIIEDYFAHNLYLDTRTGKVNDKLNRHSIFHAFNSDIYYTLENYLKVYNCIIFLSWAYGLADINASVLSNVDVKEVLYKWRAFEKIRAISKLTVKIKSSLYEKYPEFNKSEFESELAFNEIDFFLAKKKVSTIEGQLNSIDIFFKE